MKLDKMNGEFLKKGRKKFTIMMQPQLIDQLKKIAIDQKCSVSDILEILGRKYIAEN